MTTTIGELANVPAPGDPVRSPWAQDVSGRVLQRFASKAALDAGWSNAPNGARAVVLDTYRVYTRRAGAWQQDYDYGINTVTFTAGGGTVTHALGRQPAIAILTVAQNAANFVAYNTLGATTIGVRAFTQGGAAFAGNLNIAWWVG